MAVVTGAGVVLKGAELAQDQSFNSVVVSPVSGNSTPSTLKQTDANGNALLQTDTAGKLTAAALSTAGAISGASLSTTGKVTVGGDLQSTGGNTTLGPTTVSNITSSGTARVNSSLTVTGGIDVGSVNSNGNVLAQGTLTVNKGTQTVGLLTASGGLSSPSNGISVVGGTTTDSLTASGNSSLQGTVSTGALTSASVKSNGTLSVTGATTLAGLSATSSNISGNETVGGTLGVTGATSVTALTATGLVTAPNVTLTSGGGGKLTFADGTSQTTAASGTGGVTASGSRSQIDMGTYFNTNQTPNTFWTTMMPLFNAVQGGGAVSSMEMLTKMPYAGSITGWSYQQYYGNGTNTFQITKNRNSNNLNSIVTTTAGNATVTGFPGNNFSGTYTKGALAFAAGDTLGLILSWSTTSQCYAKVFLYVEWT